jgi:hypothetical protein
MSYLEQIIKASGGHSAPAEVLDEKEIRASLEAAGMLIPEEQDLADALLEIVSKHGKFDADNTGVWAGYDSAEKNAENAAIGVKCGNCVFWEAPNGCKVIQATTEEGGLCRFAILPDGSVSTDEASILATAGSKPAEPNERIKGSDKNSKGSASGGKKITFSKKVEESLKKKVEDHNKKHGDSSSKKTSLKTLKAVYRRGAGAFSTSHRPDQNRNSWAMARVNAFLHLLRTGRPKNAKYTTDNDLLPAAHAKSTKKNAASLTAAAFLVQDNVNSANMVEILSFEEYESAEHAIFSLAEYSDLSYDAIPSIRAAWIRGLDSGDSPFERASDLAINLYESKDSDLLPKREA